MKIRGGIQDWCALNDTPRDRRRDEHLHERPLSVATSPAPHLRLYMDQLTPSVPDWREVNCRALEKARALILVCTPGAAVDDGIADEVAIELRWWIENRRTAPILIAAFEMNMRWVPKPIQARWPNAQLVNVCLGDWAKESDAVRQCHCLRSEWRTRSHCRRGQGAVVGFPKSARRRRPR
jgi:hypothetical protein